MIHKDELRAAVAARAESIESRMIAWRRDFHEHPELGNQEHRTAAIVAAHLKNLGLDVRTNVAGTGVVAVLDGRARGATVALRADMDALPVKEAVAVPFASKARAEHLGTEDICALATAGMSAASAAIATPHKLCRSAGSPSLECSKLVLRSSFMMPPNRFG